LRNRVDGGGSYFVDSYAAAARLFHSDPHAFETLRKIPMPFIYDNDGYHYRYQHPTIQSSVEVTPSGASALNIEAINYSPPFQGTWKNSETSIHGMDALPKSLHAFEQCLDRDEAKYEFTMQEGDLVLFDNRRVLHARRSFGDRSGEAPMKDGEATRWLKGCYLDGDVVRNKLRVLTRSAMQGEFRPRPEWTPWLKQAGVLSGKVAAQSIDDTDSTEDSQ
jgi:alpha-ketoglutarate-dependent taurine dioxygenase